MISAGVLLQRVFGLCIMVGITSKLQKGMVDECQLIRSLQLHTRCTQTPVGCGYSLLTWRSFGLATPMGFCVYVALAKGTTSKMLFLPEPSPLVTGQFRRLSRNRRRARDRNLPDTLTLNEWLQILYACDFCCVFCGGDYECMEHVVPLSLGGGTTAANCVPCCFRCNAERDLVVQVLVARVRPIIFDDFLCNLLVGLSSGSFKVVTI